MDVETNTLNSNIRVSVSAFGRFAAYRTSAYLQSRNMLENLFTSYPYAIEDVSRDALWNIPYLKVIEALVGRYGPSALRQPVSLRLTRHFDNRVANALPRRTRSRNGNVFHGLASHCRSTLGRARELGYTTLVDSACPHPRSKVRWLEEEADLVGTKFEWSTEWVDTVQEECETADYILVPSHYSERSFAAEGFPPSKIVRVPLGVDLSEIGSSGEFRKADDIFRVLMVGSEPLRKGATYLLQAWRKLNLKRAELVIRCDVPASVKPLLEFPSVRYIPYCSRKTVINLYREASVFCFPSVDDGFGLVVLEAMAAGLPVVTTEHVGASELMTEGEDGFVVPVRSPDRIAEKLLFLYENPEVVKTMGTQAGRTAEKYTWQTYGKTLVDAYRCRLRQQDI